MSILEKPQIGEKLEGLKLQKEELEGQDLRDQIIPSYYGDLIYSTFQLRNGTIRRTNQEKTITIIVDAQTGIIKELQEK